MSKPWFRTKRYGFGAGAPCSWQGWVASLAFVGLMVGLAGLEAIDESRVRLWVGLHIGLIIGFIVLAWRTSDLPWGWRWGDE